MMLSPASRRNIARIIPFGLIWLVFSIVYSLLERGILGSLDFYPATGNPYNFGRGMVTTAATSCILGLCIGTVEILYFYRLYTRKRFIKKMVYKTAIYLATVIFFLLIVTLLYNAIVIKASVFSNEVWSNTSIFFFSFSFWGVEVYIASIIALTLLYTEISDHISQKVVLNFFTGRYHHPIEEERIFMFLDMKSSTTLAESIGHMRYFEMLKMYFADLSISIIRYGGEIYQYAGDEVIVSWKTGKGVEKSNCIRCFFAMKETIKQKRRSYVQKFGHAPEFKAGFHMGTVTTGEIGMIKKEITFTGDVLNTTSRIQSLCNTQEVDVLVSSQLLVKLLLPPGLRSRSIGEHQLRGRDEKIQLFTIDQLNTIELYA